MGERIGFVGLGVMGFPMAGHLVGKGHEVTVFNRTRARAEAWAARFGGRIANSPAEAAEGTAATFLCVGNDADVRAVTLPPDGVLAGLPEGALLVDHTTASAGLAEEINATADARGVAFVDAPVSGGQSGAESGQLTVMCGGAPDAFAHARPLIACYAKSVRHMGPAGAGQLTKMVNQICIAGLLQGLAEGVHFAEHAGLDVAAVIEVIAKGAAQSWQMDNRAVTMHARRFDFGFAVDLMRKDLAICLEEARKRGARLPVAALVDQFYGDVQAQGGGRLDTSSLIARLPSRTSQA